MPDQPPIVQVRIQARSSMLATPLEDIVVPLELLDVDQLVVATAAAVVHPPDRAPPGFGFDAGRWVAREVPAEVLAPAVSEPVSQAGPLPDDPIAMPGALAPDPVLLEAARQIPGSWVTRRSLEWVVSIPATVIGQELEKRGVGDPMPAHEAAELLDALDRDPSGLRSLDPLPPVAGEPDSSHRPGLDPHPESLEPIRPVIRRSFIYGLVVLAVLFLLVAVVVAVSAGNGT